MSPHVIRQGSITHWLNNEILSEAVGGRANVSQEIGINRVRESVDLDRLIPRRSIGVLQPDERRIDTDRLLQ